MYTFVELFLSVGVLVTLVSTLAACVCGCKNSNQKSELVGTAGVVKTLIDEEAPSPTPTTPASVKRASTQNSHRSLPEIPHPVGRHDSGDTASEIYATVNLDQGNKEVATASTSREHPYEHAYAKVQNEAHNITAEITPDQRSESEIDIEERDAGQSAAESVVISASVAISGQLPSSQELPYITPPSPRPHDNAPHFSGDSRDSTDSAKGYTSISVREPLSNIRAQTTNNRPASQPHYATVSDDSDEMYAAIEEASAGEGSDTYAQIAPDPRRRAPPAAHAARRSAPPEIGASTSANATHSRQASVSSLGAAGALGSPKPEKRQANSPLPPPPPAPAINHHRMSSTGDLHFNHDKLRRSLNEKHQRNNSCVSSSDFYGCNYPVEKHRFSSGDIIRPLVVRPLAIDIDAEPATTNHYNSLAGAPAADIPADRATDSPSRNLDDMYAKVNKKKARDDVTADGDPPKPRDRTDDPGYETIDRKGAAHGYETIARNERRNSQDPGYETVRDVGKLALRPPADHDSGPDSLVGSDPGYEHIAKADRAASDSDPNYEVLRNQPPTPPYATIAPAYRLQPTYSTVHKRPSDYRNWPLAADRPDYESMAGEPLYNTGSESDPNYESVRPKDPNYDDVMDLGDPYARSKDPKYESLRSRDSKYDSVRSKKDPNYESVKYFDVKKDPPYEKLKDESGGVERSDSSAGYERINVPPARDHPHSINNGADATVSDYFQV